MGLAIAETYARDPGFYSGTFWLGLLVLGGWGLVKDEAWHMVLPLLCFVVGNFASLTILMKNSLLENLGADYVRTAFAKGLSENRVIFVHALRNSLIPLTVDIGQALSLLFAGSFLIEKTCNIPGMGLLGYNSIIQRVGRLATIQLDNGANRLPQTESRWIWPSARARSGVPWRFQ